MATLRANQIIPPHAVKDAAKLTALVSAMLAEGWTERAILVHDDGNGVHAWTGSHRIAAAREAGVRVPVVYITGDIERRGDECRDDDERLAVLLDAEDEAAAALMRAEINANNAQEDGK